jgi:hypothetical protein
MHDVLGRLERQARIAALNLQRGGIRVTKLGKFPTIGQYFNPEKFY